MESFNIYLFVCVGRGAVCACEYKSTKKPEASDHLGARVTASTCMVGIKLGSSSKALNNLAISQSSMGLFYIYL